MNEEFEFRIQSSAVADLGPLPEVVESSSETTWKMFLQLEAQHSAKFSKTTPSLLASIDSENHPGIRSPSMDATMAEARRFNRISPTETEWLRLHALLTEIAGTDAPPAIHGAEAKRTPPLVRRIRVRDQVEWAASRGCLEEVFTFLKSLSEEQWVHMAE